MKSRLELLVDIANANMEKGHLYIVDAERFAQHCNRLLRELERENELVLAKSRVKEEKDRFALERIKGLR